MDASPLFFVAMDAHLYPWMFFLSLLPWKLILCTDGRFSCLCCHGCSSLCLMDAFLFVPTMALTFCGDRRYFFLHCHGGSSSAMDASLSSLGIAHPLHRCTLFPAPCHSGPYAGDGLSPFPCRHVNSSFTAAFFPRFHGGPSQR